jgi:hypothetical protein
MDREAITVGLLQQARQVQTNSSGIWKRDTGSHFEFQRPKEEPPFPSMLFELTNSIVIPVRPSIDNENRKKLAR